MRPGLALALAVAAGAAAADPSPFDGHYRRSVTDTCGPAPADASQDEGAIRIEESIFNGVSATCEMTAPVEVRDMEAVLYDMVCSSEDGDWTERAIFARAANGGLIMVWDGYAFVYDRCDPEGAVGAVTSSDVIGIEQDLPAAEE